MTINYREELENIKKYLELLNTAIIKTVLEEDRDLLPIREAYNALEVEIHDLGQRGIDQAEIDREMNVFGFIHKSNT